MLIEAGIDTSYIGSSLLSEKLLAIEDFVKKQPPEWINTWELLAKPVLVQNPPKLLVSPLWPLSLFLIYFDIFC